MKKKNGIIADLYDSDTGRIQESDTGAFYDFHHPGAIVEFVVGDSVTFLKVVTPSGHVIVRQIKRGNH